MDDILPPIIDFNRLDDHPNDLISICGTYGYFYLINHNINISDFFKTIKTNFFQLSLDDKLRLYPTSYVRCTALDEQPIVEQKELFLLTKQDINNKSEELNSVYKQCETIKIRLLEKIFDGKQYRKVNVSKYPIFTLRKNDWLFFF
jgi:hypothetical protein